MAPPSSPSAFPRRLALLAWILIAALPIAHIAAMTIAFSRNIVFWDEFDTALALILRIDEGASGRELLQRFFAINNEHRMLTSRLLFAASYWLTGTINFHVIGAIGNLFLVGACAILVCSAGTRERRLRLGVVLAFLMFQLEHFENFFWSGASIDHFQVVMLAVGTIAAVAHGSRLSLAVAAVLALLATFTLAHGTLAWPLGGLLLLQQRRGKHLIAWSACTAVAAAAFLVGFEFNPGHQIDEPGGKNAFEIVRYWLALLGGPLTLGEVRFAPVAGIVLLAGFGLVVARGALRREPVALFSAFFAIISLALVAFGRAELAGTSAELNSRYLVLGALAWAMLIWILLELAAEPARPFRQLAWLLPALAVFTLGANLKFAPVVESFIEVRDRAATSFMQHQIDGKGVTRLHPRDGHADALLQRAAERGVYTLPAVSKRIAFPDAMPNPEIVAHIDEFLVNDRTITIGGWAMIPGHTSRRGQARVLLRNAKSQLAFTTVTFVRSDVAQAYKQPNWLRSGFRAVIDRAQLPAEDFDVGVAVITRGGATDFIMTPNRLELSASPARAVRLPDSR